MVHQNVAVLGVFGEHVEGVVGPVALAQEMNHLNGNQDSKLKRG